MVLPGRSLLESARAAAQRRAWGEAFALLTKADAEDQLGACDLEALGEAAWTTSHYAEAFLARERAYAAYVEAGNGTAAAAMAMDMANDYYPRGQLAVADGWRSSAERLLEDAPECRAHGLLAWCRAQIALLFEGDEEGCAAQGREMVAIGKRLREPGLQMLGRATEARALARRGRVAEAFRLLGEAMAGALSGGVEPWAAANIFCQTLTVCIELGDFRRGAEWTEAAQRCCARESIVPASGDCRVHKACMLRWSGAWREAEQEAALGCEELKGNVVHMGPAMYELGEIYLRRGDLAAAEDAFGRAHELGRPPQPGLALLRLAQGRTDAAGQTLDEALAGQPLEVPRAALLPARVEVALANDDVGRARELVSQLAAIAERFGTPTMTAALAAARGGITLAAGDAADASAELRRAVELWSAIGAPYEAARARTLLAQALMARGDPEDAALELRAARSTFERLGAVPDARRAAESLAAVTGDRQAPRRASRTFVFTDIVKSTPLVEALGDEAWFDLLRWHDQTLRKLSGSTTARRLSAPATAFSWPSESLSARLAALWPSNADWRSTGAPIALRPASGSAYTPMRRRATERASPAAAFTWRRGSARWPRAAKSSRALRPSPPRRTSPKVNREPWS